MLLEKLFSLHEIIQILHILLNDILQMRNWWDLYYLLLHLLRMIAYFSYDNGVLQYIQLRLFGLIMVNFHLSLNDK